MILGRKEVYYLSIHEPYSLILRGYFNQLFEKPNNIWSIEKKKYVKFANQPKV
jgi:hypothetical protein